MSSIYLDYNATTPVAAEVTEAMNAVLSAGYGNPSSTHWAGSLARDAVEKARCQIAALLHCDATEVIFTSGGTEANNLALKGIFFARRQRQAQPHFIISQIEHPAVTEPCRFLERLGARVTRIPVDRQGMVDSNHVRRAMSNATVLISVMHANNEVGAIQPIEEIARIAHEHGALMHTDAAQSVGKILVDVESSGIDLLSVAGHKLYAPKGVGALYVRDGVQLEPLLHGAGHEGGRRAGTENVASIVGLGVACELSQSWLNAPGIQLLRDHLWERLQQAFGDRVVLNGHPTERLPNTLNVSFLGFAGNELLGHLPQIAASTGAACHAGHTQISPVLAAMGASVEVGLGAIRFSLGRETTEEELEQIVCMLSERCRTIG